MANVWLRPVQPSFDCKVHHKDAEVTICNNPELSILDNEMSRIYAAVYRAAKAGRNGGILRRQRQWIGRPDACGVDVSCISRAYQARIAALDPRQPGLSAPLARARPSFDCATHFLHAEVAVCSDIGLAQLDVGLDAQYRNTSFGLASARKRALALEQRQWLATRDTCGSDKRCLTLQYQARIEQLKVLR